MGRMSTVSMGLIGFIVLSSAVAGRRSLTAVTVISAKGAPCKTDGSGDGEGSGVGIGRVVSSGTTSCLTLFRFLVTAAFFTGSSTVAVDIIVVSGSSTSEGSTGAMLFFGRPRARGAAVEVEAVDAMDLRERVCLRGLLVWGANSSSSSAACLVIVVFISSSSEESTTVRLVAARREGRDDAAVDMIVVCVVFYRPLGLARTEQLKRSVKGKKQNIKTAHQLRG